MSQLSGTMIKYPSKQLFQKKALSSQLLWSCGSGPVQAQYIMTGCSHCRDCKAQREGKVIEFLYVAWKDLPHNLTFNGHHLFKDLNLQ